MPITADQLLLRVSRASARWHNAHSCDAQGARLAETAWVYGVVVYTGIHSKLVLNSNAPRYKRSKVEEEMNQQMYLIFLMQFILVLLCAIVSGVWQYQEAAKNWYLYDDSSMSNTGRVSGACVHVRVRRAWLTGAAAA